MANESLEGVNSGTGWKNVQVYTMAGICLVVGLLIGYLFRGSESRLAKTPSASSTTAENGNPSAATPQTPTLDQMKQMADKQAEPLLEKLKANPNNSSLLNQIGTIYKLTHQFKPAVEYYQKAIQADPRNVGARTDLASCLYYEGDVDGALQQLEQSLQYDSKDASALFNLGMIRWQAKNDASGAVSAWQQLLKSNPKLTDDRKTEVEKLIALARQHSSTGKASETTKER
ncbi:MAG: tetratricopeptide repeat protein [Candidatus Sulfotelmatobacter sp.]